MANFFDVRQTLYQTRRGAGGAGDIAPAAGARAAPGEALSVSQLTVLIDKALKGQLPPTLLVKGEISNYKLHGASGHTYFTLKDGQNCIDCVIWKADGARIQFRPADGMEVLATGCVKAYGARGRYQLYTTHLQPLGQGALELAFQRLRAKLEAEGLFAAERKKPLPRYPLSIALVTSRGAAGYQDMLKVLRPFAWVQLFLFHCPVQGDGAAAKIAEALGCIGRGCAGVGGVDLILLGRGGGSLEDLWAFNEEPVARAIARCRVPVITGIGHEIDVSIADLVADHHAHTPTEAARVAVAHWRSAGEAIDSQTARLRRGVRGVMQEARHRLAMVEQNEVFRRPLEPVNKLRQLLDDRQRGLALAAADRLREQRRRMEQWTQRLERHRPSAVLVRWREQLRGMEQRLDRAAIGAVRGRSVRLTALAAALAERHPRHPIGRYGDRLSGLGERLERSAGRQQRQREARLAALERQLRALGPEQVLQRGYTITTRKKDGAVVRSAEALKTGDRIVTRFADGQVESTVDDARQMSLFE
jgi:exodeoxyribonuclease VII large subunit